MITISILIASHYILLQILLSLPESSNYQSLLYLVTSIEDVYPLVILSSQFFECSNFLLSQIQ